MDTAALIGLISSAVAIIGLLITIIEKWDVIASRTQAVCKESVNKFTSISFSLSRRQFIGVSLLAVVGVISHSLKLFNMTSRLKHEKWSSYAAEQRFVVNQKNGVIHLKGICDDHLPASQTTVNNSTASHLHGSKRQQITMAVLKYLPDNLKEELLIDAIKESPTSTHLYTYLTKQWGRTKEYHRIHEFLSVNIKFLESKLANHKTDKEKRRYAKAINELRIKKNHAEYLASISKF